MKITQQELDIYKKKIKNVAFCFDHFCNQYDLRYFAIKGTALGMIRHGGFIPWDDDIDFVMPRPDYEKFIHLSHNLPLGYEVYSHATHQEYHLQFAKMCDANTSLLVDSRSHCMMGAFIDIFPMDGLPDTDDEGRVIFFETYLRRRRQAYSNRFHYHFTDYIRSLYRRDFISIKRQFISDWRRINGVKEDPYIECDKITMLFDYDTSEYVVNYGTNQGAKEISPRTWFDTYYYAPFEDIQLRLPVGVKNYLKQVYGDKYMQLPPESKRIARHSFYYLNLNKRVSYRQAINELKKTY